MNRTNTWWMNLSVGFSLGIALSGCGSRREATPAAVEAELKTPTRDILVTDGDLNKPYTILGQVEATLTGESVYSTMSMSGGTASPEAAKKAKDLLRKVAYTKYGDRVDAIINAKIHGGYSGGFGGAIAGSYGARTGTVDMEGIAVEFKKSGSHKKSSTEDEDAPAPKKRRKHSSKP